MSIQYNHEPLPVLSLFLEEDADTQRLGEQLAECVTPGLVVALSGSLGAGKTTLARALLRALGVTGTIKSPSYSWVECYVTNRGAVNHFDFYRFKDQEDWEAYGFECYFNNTSVALIEWSENVLGYLPPIDLLLKLDYQAAGRHAALTPFTSAGQLCLEQLIQASQMQH
jgi:tRNA threonylcarbamoyladenosine biosynthesis protein TsaE